MQHSWVGRSVRISPLALRVVRDLASAKVEKYNEKDARLKKE